MFYICLIQHFPLLFSCGISVFVYYIFFLFLSVLTFVLRSPQIQRMFRSPHVGGESLSLSTASCLTLFSLVTFKLSTPQTRLFFLLSVISWNSSACLATVCIFRFPVASSLGLRRRFSLSSCAGCWFVLYTLVLSSLCHSESVSVWLSATVSTDTACFWHVTRLCSKSLPSHQTETRETSANWELEVLFSRNIQTQPVDR